MVRKCSFLSLWAALLLPGAAASQDPGNARWIWGWWAEPGNRPDQERCWFRKELDLAERPEEARLWISADNHFEFWVNGRRAGRGDDWRQPQEFEIAALLGAGRNVLAVEAWNDGGPAALLASGAIVLPQGPPLAVSSDSGWRSAPRAEERWHNAGFQESEHWQPAAEIGRYGDPPWLGLSWRSSSFEPLPGFRVAETCSGVGSLIALCLDDRDRAFVSVEGGGILRLEDRDGDGRHEITTSYSAELRDCQGLCWTAGALYAVGQGPQGGGLYRVAPDGGARLLGRFDGGGEHGPHGVIPGPDGRLYLAIGNHTAVLEDPDPESPYRVWYEGHLLERILDPGGHATHVAAPGGVILATDLEGRRWSVLAGGLRNAYDLAFNRYGDLFTWDSDMEWDIGLPWYRPTRVLHLIPGGEYGWRTGSSKWPEEFPDSLPAAIAVGRGSPTGLVHYDGLRFPARFRGAILGGDWSQGLILAFHLRPHGASYQGSAEVLLRGQPLNVTDLAVEQSGNLLFTTGGRGTRGAVYRLICDEPEAAAPDGTESAAGAGPPPWPRRQFTAATGLEELLAALTSDDRFWRYPALRELETRALDLWLAPALALNDPRATAEALVAAARTELDAATVQQLWREAEAKLRDGATGPARIALLRAFELLLLHDPAPPPEFTRGAAEILLDLYPCGERIADRQIAALLADLQPPGTTAKLLAALEQHPFREERLHLAYCLSRGPQSWNPQDLERLWRALEEARAWPGGYSYQGYVRIMQEAVEKQMEPQARLALAGARLARRLQPAAAAARAAGGEPLDFERTLSFLQQSLREPRRSLAEGARVFDAACANCHAFGARGRGVGPDLSSLRGRFALADQLEAVLAPSRQVSDQYHSLDVTTRDGQLWSGLPLLEDERRLVLLLADLQEREIPLGEIRSREVSPLSLMPSGLLDDLTLEEVADLFAFLNATAGETDSLAPAESPWQPLFDGRSLAGWSGDPALWRVDKGVLWGEARDLPRSSFLISEEEYGDFWLELDVKLLAGNSGVQFRSTAGADGGLRGYQADAGASYWGSLYEEGGRGMLVQAEEVIWLPGLAPGGWNHYCIEVIGDRIRIELNGCTTVDLRDGRAARGLLGLQLHAGEHTAVAFRNLRIRRP